VFPSIGVPNPTLAPPLYGQVALTSWTVLAGPQNPKRVAASTLSSSSLVPK